MSSLRQYYLVQVHRVDANRHPLSQLNCQLPELEKNYTGLLF